VPPRRDRLTVLLAWLLIAVTVLLAVELAYLLWRLLYA
jgi:hypothetical protein